jgi:hypothetical protein
MRAKRPIPVREPGDGAAFRGHRSSVDQILAKYLPRGNELAWSAQKKRGLIADGDVIQKNRA